MAFSAGQYQRAVSGQQQSAGALQRGKSQAASKQIQAQEFGLDETVKYAGQQKKASSMFGNWKQGLGLLGGLAAMAIGAPWLLAAGMAGGGTFLGGKIGKGKAKKELDKSKFFKGQTGQVMDYMDKDITKSTVMAAAMAAGGAHLRDVAKAKDLAAAGEASGGVDMTGWTQGDVAVYEKSGIRPPGQTPFEIAKGQPPSDISTFDKPWSTPRGENVDPMSLEGKFSKEAGRDLELFSDDFVDYEFPEVGPAQPSFAQRGIQNLGYTAKGVTDYGKGFFSNQMFNKGASMSDLFNNVKMASSIYGAVNK